MVLNLEVGAQELDIIIFLTLIDCDFISIHHWMKWYKFGF